MELQNGQTPGVTRHGVSLSVLLGSSRSRALTASSQCTWASATL
ncbi:Arrb2 [Phodopus roborovskii]|uniref:Arrb2 protein n=1 Tax=Phodopus roborovskii TaxID=109678 RepID=A0AAU9Z1T9_PHORO|nr:Arrb2 [Phodopus roborovskii]